MTEPNTTLIDPFDPARFRLGQDFGAAVGVKKLVTTIPVGRPGGHDFFRVNPDPAFRLNAPVIELKEDREVYLVAPEMLAELPGSVKAKTLFTTISRQGVLRLWPVALPEADGRRNDWARSAVDAADHAMRRWVRLAANMSLGAYEIYEAQGQLPEPEWPDLAFGEILKIAFRDRIIDRSDHPVVQRLQGLA
jgi:hypothetical protein